MNHVKMARRSVGGRQTAGLVLVELGESYHHEDGEQASTDPLTNYTYDLGSELNSADDDDSVLVDGGG